MISHTWASTIGKNITAISKGISEIIARLAEPLMRYSTIYLALATGLSFLMWAPVYQACQGIVIATPEFVLLGAFTVAENAIHEGRKKWGSILFAVCILLAAIMIATFVSIFIVKFDEPSIKILNFSRCLVAFGFSIALNKLEQEQEPISTAISQPPVDKNEPIDYAKLATEVATLLAPRIAEMRAEIIALIPEKPQSIDVAELASQVASLLSTEDNSEDSLEDSERTPIDLETARMSHMQYEQETAGDSASAVTKREDNDLAKKVRRIVLKNPDLSSTEIAEKASCSRSYAGKIKSQVLKDKIYGS